MKGLTASLTDENEVVFYDAETGEPQYYFPVPYMIDADGNISNDVAYRIESGESSAKENSNEESSAEESSTEESSLEESSIGEGGTEESSLEENSVEESTDEKGTPEQTTAEETERSETEISPALGRSALSGSRFEMKGLTLSGNVQTSKD